MVKKLPIFCLVKYSKLAKKLNIPSGREWGHGVVLKNDKTSVIVVWNGQVVPKRYSINFIERC